MSELQQTPAAPAEDRPDWAVDTVLDGQSIRTVTPKLLSPLIKVGYPVLGIICLAVALFLALLEGRFTLFVGVYLALALAIFLLRWLLPRQMVERQLRALRESYGTDRTPMELVFWPQGLVLHNLTSGGHVDLRCGTGPDGCPFLEVEDNGIGIPQDSQSRVFERFYRAMGGTGLGLAIVKHIALLHDAHIDLQSQVGTGTTIKVTFPKNS